MFDHSPITIGRVILFFSSHRFHIKNKRSLLVTPAFGLVAPESKTFDRTSFNTFLRHNFKLGIVRQGTNLDVLIILSE